MGAEPYWYYIKYQTDVNIALQELRQREFSAGRYFPVVDFISDLCPIGPDSPAPGAQHASIQEAIIDAEADGTRSILDLDRISDTPGFYVASPLQDAVLESLYGTTRPTRAMVEQNMDFFEDIERGHGIYTVIYKDNEPDELLFAGYSFD